MLGYDDAEEIDGDAFNNMDISAPESGLRTDAAGPDTGGGTIILCH